MHKVPGRSNDYITRPKGDGYKNLHVAVDTSEPVLEGKKRPLMKIQICTKDMNAVVSLNMPSTRAASLI
ncbi:hypothetical protein GUJ93_ZPchr0003g17928 [Zizania palustris]|uniref:RelA/SpoT domain-containing protein n=1 Tax=Zizania palustris TaxID=103762 RepID=A0A8J5VW77_ZIZPA|nr:hypothetical protein GUJ93_ZPchr0003g17928 [Zizania palustris]